MLEVDRHGFDEVDRKLLLTIIEKYQGGPVGVNTLAAALAEEPDAIEEIYEPFLIQIGFLNRTPRGRVATMLAYEHFGITPNRRQLPCSSCPGPAVYFSVVHRDNLWKPPDGVSCWVHPVGGGVHGTDLLLGRLPGCAAFRQTIDAGY